MQTVEAFSEAIRGHQRSSDVIRGRQRSSEVIRGHQRSSEVIRGHQRASEGIRGHQRSSEVIRGHPSSHRSLTPSHTAADEVLYARWQLPEDSSHEITTCSGLSA